MEITNTDKSNNIIETELNESKKKEEEELDELKSKSFESFTSSSYTLTDTNTSTSSEVQSQNKDLLELKYPTYEAILENFDIALVNEIEFAFHIVRKPTDSFVPKIYIPDLLRMLDFFLSTQELHDIVETYPKTQLTFIDFFNLVITLDSGDPDGISIKACFDIIDIDKVQEIETNFLFKILTTLGEPVNIADLLYLKNELNIGDKMNFDQYLEL